MGFAHRAFVAAGVGFAVSAIAGCGSSGGSWLSGAQGRNLTAQLNRVTQALDNQNCAQAQQYLADFQSTVDNMGNVNSTLINDIDQGSSTVQSLATRDCRTVTTTPKKTHPKTNTTTTTTATQTQTFTNPSTQTYTAPTYTQATDTTNSTTNTTGGTCPTCYQTVTTTSTTSTTSSTTTPNGGTGLGGGTDTSTGSDTTTASTTGTSGSGF
ncbi:MAG TPA: hypothetical protein VG228_07545 [Solirubrobacteraceae bacterium]|nr:hypothetical protein [Solirubrobacteraceae bacterium]